MAFSRRSLSGKLGRGGLCPEKATVDLADFLGMRLNHRIDMDEKALIEFFHHLNRRRFLDTATIPFARLDQPLPIGFGQTISQPTLVRISCWLLLVNADRILYNEDQP